MNLQPISSFQEAREIWALGKVSGQASLTNFFLSQLSIERAIRKKQLFAVAQSGGSLLLRRDRDFHHLYLNFSNPDTACRLINNLHIETPVVADVIYRENSHLDMINLLSEAGFVRYRHLHRRIRPPQDLPHRRSNGDIHSALDIDAKEILSDLELHFDRFSEQLPELDEVRNAISMNQIIVSRLNSSLAGFLFFESSAKSSHLRYWFVKPDFRDRQVGTSLIRNYLEYQCPSTLSQLWVVDENDLAIRKYDYYGYSSSNLCDQVMIRRKNI